MPATELFAVRPVELARSLEQLLSKPGCKAACDMCGEEIINEREVVQDGRTLCRAGDGYWRNI
jgi:formylmethanofuran dehydrogenase subunit E